MIDPHSLTTFAPAKVVDIHGKKKQVRNGPLTEAFSSAWAQPEIKAELRAQGVSISFYNGKAQVAWWTQYGIEEIRTLERKLEASKATTADIMIPVPEGLNYLPYQKAGIAFLKKVFTGQSTPTFNQKGVSPSISSGALLADEMGL